MTNPLVSIVIPLFNKRDFILDTLNSVKDQDFKDWECIIVDDGSTDGSYELVREFIHANPGSWKMFTQDNRGVASARNRSISESCGKFIALLDADDVWPPWKLRLQLEIIAKEDCDLLLGSYVVFRESRPLYLVKLPEVRVLFDNWSRFLGHGPAFSSSALIKREFILTHPFSDDLSTAADLEFCLYASQNGKLYVSNQVFLFYRVSANQIHRNLKVLYNDMLKIYRVYFSDSYGSLKSYLDTYVTLKSLRRLEMPFVNFRWTFSKILIALRLTLSTLARKTLARVQLVVSKRKYSKILRNLVSS